MMFPMMNPLGLVLFIWFIVFTVLVVVKLDQIVKLLKQQGQTAK